MPAVMFWRKDALVRVTKSDQIRSAVVSLLIDDDMFGAASKSLRLCHAYPTWWLSV